MEEVGARVSLRDARKAQRDARDVARSVRAIGDEGERAGRKLSTMNTASRRLAGGMGTLTRGAGLAVAGGTALTVAFGVRAYRAFDESRRVMAVTEAHIRSTGGAANLTAGQVAGLSQRLSDLTGVDDEAIQTGANLLLTFKQIRNEAGKGNQVFDRATAAAVDLSKAGFGSIDSASKTLGKALNDPVRGMTALGRAGVTFTEGQKAQIERLVEANDLLGAQRLILREVESQVGGTAAKQASNTDRLQVSVGNLEEAIGSGLYPAVDAVSGDLNELAQRVLPGVERAAARVSGIFRSDDLDWVSKLKFSGRAVAAELAPEMRPLVAELERELGRVDAGGAIDSAIRRGAPVMADALAAQVPHMASAFVDAFRNAGPGGQLLTVGVLAAKFGAFRPLGALAAGWFSGAFGGGVAASTPAIAAESAAYGRVVGRAYGTAAGTAAAADMVKAASVGTAASVGGGGVLATTMSRAGAVAGRLFGVAAAAYIGYEIDQALKSTDRFGQYSGSKGWGELWRDTKDWLPGEDSESQRRRQRRQANTPSPASPSPRTGRITPKGPIALPTRDAQFSLPGGRDDTLTFTGPLILQIDGRKLHEQTVTVEARRARRR